MRDPRRVAILISGRGSNMQALVEQARGYEVVLVASNKPQAAGLDWARARGLPTWALDSKGVGKEQFDRRLSAALELASRLHCGVVLKGAGSVLAFADGGWAINASGNAAISRSVLGE